MSRVLVVEDESAIAELISINLRHAGYEVTIASAADQAQMEVDRVLPDLVILDWMLPGQSGLALAKRWRSEARTKELPVIMLTARADEADKIAGLDAGADDYLTKPFHLPELEVRQQQRLLGAHPKQSPQHLLLSLTEPEPLEFGECLLRGDVTFREGTRAEQQAEVGHQLLRGAPALLGVSREHLPQPRQ